MSKTLRERLREEAEWYNIHQGLGFSDEDVREQQETRELLLEAESQLSALQADAQRKDEALYQPKPDRLIQAYTPTHYPGSFDNVPPPYINVYESRDAVPSVIVTVRSVANKDGTPGLTSCIEIRQPEFREFLTYAARWLGWLPITEEQWLRYYALSVGQQAPEA